MNVAARIVLGLVAVTLAVGVFAIAHGQTVGRVGTVGALMSPTDGSAGGGTPSNAIATEDDLGLLTEGDEFITTES